MYVEPAEHTALLLSLAGPMVPSPAKPDREVQAPVSHAGPLSLTPPYLNPLPGVAKPLPLPRGAACRGAGGRAAPARPQQVQGAPRARPRGAGEGSTGTGRSGRGCRGPARENRGDPAVCACPPGPPLPPPRRPPPVSPSPSLSPQAERRCRGRARRLRLHEPPPAAGRDCRHRHRAQLPQPRRRFRRRPAALPEDGPAVKRMAVTFEQAQRVGYTLLKALLRFAFMVANNLVAIPSYVLYLIVLQPLRVLDSKLFWYIEGVLFKWLLAMVASWGWWAGYTVVEWGDDVKAVSEDEAMVLVNHQATGDVCTLMMCLQDKGTVVRQMMWLMDHIFKYTNFGIVSLIHGDFFIRQGKAHRDQQLVLLQEHLEKYYRSRNRKWIVLFPEGGFLRKRRETSQAFAKKNNLPFLKHVTLPRLGATQVILKTLVAPQENGTPAGRDAVIKESKSKGLQWVIDTTIAYPKGEPIDIQTWILGYRQPTVTHVHYRIFPIKEVPAEPEALTHWLYQRFIEKEDLLTHFYETGAFPPLQGQTKAVSRAMTLSNLWLVGIQSLAFLSGGMWYCILQYFYHCLF